MQQWVVMDDDLHVYPSFEAMGESALLHVRRCMRRSMFPSTFTTTAPLQRCMRFVPHDADTGGFFVAVLRKRGPELAPLHPNSALRCVLPIVPIPTQLLDAVMRLFHVAESERARLSSSLFVRTSGSNLM